MKTIKNSKEITILEIGDEIVFGNLKYEVCRIDGYFLSTPNEENDIIFNILNISKRDFVRNLGIDTLPIDWSFPETRSLEALTVIVSALLKEYEKQNELPKTWKEFCNRNKKGDKKFCLYHGDIVGTGVSKDTVRDTTLMESAEEAAAFRALMQLRQLRKCYIGEWEPDWTNGTKFKYCINLQANNFSVECWHHMNSSFSFPNLKLAKQFLDNFRGLLEIAKPLL